MLVGFFVFSLFFFPSTTYAKKVLPRVQKATAGATKTTSTTRGVKTSVKFREDKRAIIVNFISLSIASSVNYTLSYNSRGTTQGAGGTINTGLGDSQIREILFGTCSHGVCRYDTGITNAKLVVTTTLKNGLKISKSFRLKV